MSANDAEGEEEVEILWENRVLFVLTKCLRFWNHGTEKGGKIVSMFQKIPRNATSVMVGKDITYIRDGAFEDRECLKKVDMSGAYSLKSIGHRAFQYCSALSIIKWAPNLKTIGKGAFGDCTSLDQGYFP